ncbi:RNA polymerase sigma factor [Actinomadura kijaniata]|uniref:RNA polymerase sigma-70 factor (ECF subfamily) n=1 Tax=Actinomadura namibiensis TaxID=182080 RepID=A0A7W3LU21_ACTNM|nr:RNA polymerase sigma factor [Actinomadura namibiensis]MBA8954331.1 RNA polymerase sigma-70 factor (ECF subfamily) [Actinomadura namibiensis]
MIEQIPAASPHMLSPPAAPDEEDAAVIQRSLREPEAFAVLFRRYAPEIRRYVARRLGPDVADDITADTFLNAFRRRDSFDTGRASARPWLYGIATNLVGMHRRAEVRLYRNLARTGIDPVTESFADQVDAQVSAGSTALAAALGRLPAAQRDVVLLIAWAELSYEEAATALKIPIGTVRSRMNRARGKLRDALGKETDHG